MMLQKIQKVQKACEREGFYCKMQNHSIFQQRRSIEGVGLGVKLQSRLNFHKQYDESKNIAIQTKIFYIKISS